MPEIGLFDFGAAMLLHDRPSNRTPVVSSSDLIAT